MGLRPRRRHRPPHRTGTTRWPTRFDLSGHATGWGLNFSSNLKPGKNDVIRLQFVYGEGIQNYMNDSPVDVGIVSTTPAIRSTPLLKGELIPLLGTVFFLDHTWNAEVGDDASGFSHQNNDNTDGQAPDAFHRGMLRARQPALHAGGRRDDGRRIPVGPPRELR